MQRADASSMAAAAQGGAMSPPISPRANLDVKLLRATATAAAAAGGRGGGGKTTMGTWIKEQKERKRAEARSRNAQAYAATSVAGVAAAVAALVAGAVFSLLRPPKNGGAATRTGTAHAAGAAGAKTAAAIASAAALVASHCVEMAQAIGASHDQILGAIQSAVNAQTSGDIMALTAGAATACAGGDAAGEAPQGDPGRRPPRRRRRRRRHQRQGAREGHVAIRLRLQRRRASQAHKTRHDNSTNSPKKELKLSEIFHQNPIQITLPYASNCRHTTLEIGHRLHELQPAGDHQDEERAYGRHLHQDQEM